MKMNEDQWESMKTDKKTMNTQAAKEATRQADGHAREKLRSKLKQCKSMKSMKIHEHL